MFRSFCVRLFELWFELVYFCLAKIVEFIWCVRVILGLSGWVSGCVLAFSAWIIGRATCPCPLAVIRSHAPARRAWGAPSEPMWVARGCSAALWVAFAHRPLVDVYYPVLRPFWAFLWLFWLLCFLPPLFFSLPLILELSLEQEERLADRVLPTLEPHDSSILFLNP